MPNKVQSATRAGGWWRVVVALLMLVVGLGHFNRIAISVAGAERIIPENGIDAPRMGQVYSAFLLFYTLAMVPAGWLIDRFGGAGDAHRLLFWVRPLRRGHERGRTLFANRAVALDGTAGRSLVDGTRQCTVASGGGPHGLRPRADQREIARQRIGDIRRLCGNLGHVLRFRSPDRPLELALRLPRDGHGSRWSSPCAGPGERRGLPQSPRSLSDVPTSAGDAGRLSRSPANRTGSVFLRPGVICLALSYAALGYFQYLFFYWIQYYIGTVQHLGTDVSRRYSTLITLTMGTGNDFWRLAGRPRVAVLLPAVRGGGWFPGWE